MDTLLLMLPDVAMVALGLALSRGSVWDRGFWDGLEKLVYFVLFPALLFNSILKAPLSIGSAAPVMAGAVAVVGAGIALGWLAARVLQPDPVRFASGVQTAFRFNSYVAFALAQRLGGEAGLALCAMLAGVIVPMVNVAAVLALARNAGGGWWNAILRNPLVMATLEGMVGNGLGLTLPEPLSASIARLGTAALATGLLTVGAGLVIKAEPVAGDRSTMSMTLWFTATKLLLMPALALALATLVSMAPLERTILVMFSAMPTASTCYILATRMGGDGSYVARLVTLSMLTSLATLPVWLSLVR